MKKGSQQGSVAAISPVIDWVAYRYLQTKLSRTINTFRQEALEFALQKLLSPLPRAASGKQLAMDLFRDGKRHAKIRRRTGGKHDLAENFFQEIFGANATEVQEDTPMVDPSGQLVKGFGRLTIQERTALYLRAVGYDSAELIQQHLHIGPRQFRNLLQSGRTKLQRTTGFEAACAAHQLSELPYNSSLLTLLENTLIIPTKVG